MPTLPLMLPSIQHRAHAPPAQRSEVALTGTVTFDPVVGCLVTTASRNTVSATFLIGDERQERSGYEVAPFKTPTMTALRHTTLSGVCGGEF